MAEQELLDRMRYLESRIESDGTRYADLSARIRMLEDNVVFKPHVVRERNPDATPLPCSIDEMMKRCPEGMDKTVWRAYLEHCHEKLLNPTLFHGWSNFIAGWNAARRTK